MTKWIAIATTLVATVSGRAQVEETLKEVVPKLRAEKKLIGLAAMVTVKGKRVAAYADGVRMKGNEAKVTVDDRWHVGSVTKSMTASMIARLVEKKKLRWDMTLAQCFGDDLKIDEQWRDVTLHELLTHTAGARANFPLSTMLKRPKPGKARVAARRQAVGEILAAPPGTPPRQAYLYSNVGFTIAGVMAEHVTGMAWEDLMRRELFKPLQLKSAGFGPPQSKPGQLGQPRGHAGGLFSKRIGGESEDNTPIMGPAGTVHMTLNDLCRFGAEHLQGSRGNGKLLKKATYARLHTPNKKDYAYGLIAPARSRYVKGKLIWHNGSNTLWFTLLALLPDRDAVIAVTSNDGDIRRAQSAAFQIVREVDAALEKAE